MPPDTIPDHHAATTRTHSADKSAPPSANRKAGPSDVARTLARTVATAALDIFLPPVCLSCHVPLMSRHTVCAQCWQHVTFIRQPLCDRLGIPLPYDAGDTMISAAAQASPPVYRKARSVAKYDGVMRKLIHDFKFRDRHETRVLFGRWLENAGVELLRDADLITPVPLYRLRLLSRRFNQSAILARELSKHHTCEFDPHLLERTRRTKPQVGLSAKQRARNVHGAFTIPNRRTSKVKNRKVLLIDDVITTGATVNACARTLIKGGALQVDVLSLALVTDAAQMTT